MKASLLARAVPALLLAGVMAGGLATPGLAQTGSPGATQQASPSMHRQGETDQSLVQRRIEDLRTRLHITRAQEPQWHAFTRVMRENARSMDEAYRERAERLSNMNALQDLQSYARLERQRAHDVERLVTPFSHLYAVLSPEQKRDADHLFRAYARHYDRQHQQQNSSR